MYYLNTRYYDSSIGRFINEDTVEGRIDKPSSRNLYSYCYNNPLIFNVPTGNTAQDFLMGIGDVLLAGLDNYLVKWVLGKMGLGIKDYEYESAIDYYAGRVAVGSAEVIAGAPVVFDVKVTTGWSN